MMGNQGTANNGVRRGAALIKAGALGVVTDVHVWTNRPIWPQGGKRNEPETPPSQLHWDLWLGPAPLRPYAKGYHTFSWRGWWDFGTGALGDMACHTANMPFMALDLRDPISVVAETSGHNKDSYPKSSKITFEFNGNGKRGPVTLHWYDGHNIPPAELMPGIKYSDSGCMIIGNKGKLYSPNDYGAEIQITDGVDVGDPDFVHSPGHFEEFAIAIKEGKQAMSNFPDYAGPLTETILLGNLAVWADGKKIEWDAKHLRTKNAPEVADIVRPKYRKGYSL